MDSEAQLIASDAEFPPAWPRATQTDWAAPHPSDNLNFAALAAVWALLIISVFLVEGSVLFGQSRGVRLELLSIMAINKRCKQTQGCIYYFRWKHPKNTSQAFQFLLSKNLELKHTGWCPTTNSECSKNPLSYWMCFQYYFTHIYSCFLFLLSAFISFRYFWLELCNSLSHLEPVLCWWLTVCCISDLHVFLLQNQYSTWI